MSETRERMAETRKRRTPPPPSAWTIAQAKHVLERARDDLLAIDAAMPDDQKLWTDMLEGTFEGDVFEIIDRIMRAQIDAELDAEAIANRIEELNLRKSKKLFWAGRYRVWAKELLEAARIKSRHQPDFDASTYTPKHGRAVVPDLDNLDPAYVRIVKEPKLAEVRAALIDGKEVEGAYLSNPEPVLRMVRK